MIERTKIGANPKIFFPDLVNIFDCTIGDDVIIGPFVEITRNVIVGNNCSIESHAFLCDSVVLEDDVFISHGAMFVNDLFPRSKVPVQFLPTLVKRGASIGTNATIVAGVTIGEYAIVGAGAVVTRDVPACAIWAGNPARELKRFGSPAEIEAYMRAKQPLARRAGA